VSEVAFVKCWLDGVWIAARCPGGEYRLATSSGLEKYMPLFKSVMAAGVIGVILTAGLPREAFAARQAAAPAPLTADDETLQSRVTTAFKKDATLAPRDIDVDVSQGVVTLTGTVRTVSEKTRAARLARTTGVTRVNNEIEIDPKIDESKIDAAGEKTKAGLTKAVDATVDAAHKTKGAVQKGVGKSEEGVGKAADKTSTALGRVSDKASDASITTRVKAGFSGEELLKNAAIDVETTSHIVTLRGTVASDAAKTRAEELALKIDGVTRVVNQIVVKEK
jgi:osmotically-inducible protein OsmY